MHVSYGPPGLKGVTSLVAVGADESDTGTDRVLKIGALGGIAVAAYGAYTRKRGVRNVGLGAAAALGLALFATGAFGRKVTVTQGPPTTTPTGGVFYENWRMPGATGDYFMGSTSRMFPMRPGVT